MNHEPRPAQLHQDFPYQRRFVPSDELAMCFALQCAFLDSYGVGADLFRDAEKDTVRLSLRLGSGCGEVGLPFNAMQLKELARMCIDAAHDLEAFPSAELMKGLPS